MKKGYQKTLLLATSLVLLTGCFNKKEEPKKEPQKAQQQVYQDRQLKVSDIKKKYRDNNNSYIKPLYNVKPDTEFTFHFKSYLGDLSPEDIITVHTDEKVEDDSKIEADLQFENFDVSATTLHVSPYKPVMGSTGSKTNWGLANMYYLKINYDLDSKVPVKLKKPFILPFNVKTKLRTPNVKTVITKNGDIELQWTKQDASQYLVYNLPRVDKEGQVEKNLSSKEEGYSYSKPTLLGKTSKTKFKAWKGTAKTYDRTISKEVITQNRGFTGDFFVVSKKGKSFSKASNLISTQEIAGQIPFKLIQLPSKTEYFTTRSLPKSIKVQMMDGSFSYMHVVYNTKKAKKVKGTSNEYKIPFKVDKSRFKGVVKVKRVSKEDLKKLEFENSELFVANEPTPINNTENTPLNNYPTIDKKALKLASKIINAKDIDKDNKKPVVSESTEVQKLEPQQELSVQQAKDKEKSLNKDGIVSQQREITKYEIGVANEELVTIPKYMYESKIGVYATNALEEYLALKLVQFPKEISLKAFPQGQENTTLDDTLRAVITQNMYVHSIKSWKYDYNRNVIKLTYTQPSDKLKSMNEELASLIKTNFATYNKPKKMTDKDFAFRLMIKLQSKIRWGTTENDLKPLSEEQQQNLRLTKVLDSYLLNRGKRTQITNTAYSALKNGVADDKGYSSLYASLLRSKGVNAIVATGKLNGVDKNWVKVKKDGRWYNIDPSSSLSNTGVPYQMFYADDNLVRALGIVETKTYLRDSLLSNIKYNQDYSEEFYRIKGLEITKLSNLDGLIVQALKTNKDVYFRIDDALLMSDVYNHITEVVQTQAPLKLPTSNMTIRGRYGYFTPNYVKPQRLERMLSDKKPVKKEKENKKSDKEK